MKEIGLSTPREILNKFALIIQKPKPNEMMVKTVIDRLPLDSEEKSHLHLHGWEIGQETEVLKDQSYYQTLIMF